MKEGLIASNYECSKCNERIGLYERKSAVLDGDFEFVCSTIASQNIYGRTSMIILLTMRPSRLFVKIRCHAVASTLKRSAVRNVDDNAPCHRTVAAEQLLESEDIERMDWPARSPDLNPSEHVRDFLGRRLLARTLPPVTIRELRLALQDEWAAMPQQLIDTLILSMGRRCETCLAVRGDHIPY
ncbi:transposable element Tcb2 transposase [Trichonephila clavipes]|nr:transposable element Tcb2 transposase [Trichonephila clavipes]